MKTLIQTIAVMGILLGALTSNASDKKQDATKSQCESRNKIFVKHSVRKNGVQVAAYCRTRSKRGAK